jgi:hypothetical protein
MQTQHSLAISQHEHTHGDFIDRLTRYETAIRAAAESQYSDDEALAELKAARQSLSDLSRVAKAAFDAKFTPPEGDRLFGRALKDWATAIMENRGVTRAVARERILEAIKLMTTREYPALNPNVPSYVDTALLGSPFQMQGAGRGEWTHPND